MKWIIALLCFLLAGFCVFGFVASFEPTANARTFRLGYSILGIGSTMAGLAAVRWKRRR